MGGHRRVHPRRDIEKRIQTKGIWSLLLVLLLVTACRPQADLAPRPWAALLDRSTPTLTADPTNTPGHSLTSTATPFLPMTNTPIPTPTVVVTVLNTDVTRAAATQAAEASRKAALPLPDLQTLPPTDVRLVADWSTGRTYVRFSNAILNSGPGPLELIGLPDPAVGVIRVTQRILSPQGEILDEQAFGEFVFHPYHNHWHLEDFANYEVWSLDERGQLDAVIGTGNKVSYCVTDMERAPGGDPAVDSPVRRTYTNCWGELQGLSSYWIDIYASNLYGQWVEITDLEDGTYALVSTVDPENLILEGNEDNNTGWVYFELANARLQVTDKPPVILPNKIE